jgi:hypothetical protein
MPDGGWNCRRSRGATHSRCIRPSARGRVYGTTNCIAEEAFARCAPHTAGREFLLIHRLFRSHRTGQVIKPVFTQFSFPPRWHYDILRALDYFQAVNAPYDERLAEAIDIVRRNQGANGSWTLQNTYRGKTYF